MKPIKHILFHITVYTQVTILVQNVCVQLSGVRYVINTNQKKKKKNLNNNISRFIFTFIILFFFFFAKFIAYFRIKIYVFFFFILPNYFFKHSYMVIYSI